MAIIKRYKVKSLPKPKPPLRRAVVYYDSADAPVSATEENYEDFCAAVMRFTRLLNLNNWHLEFRWEANEGPANACVWYEWEDRQATFVFGRKLGRAFLDEPVLLMKLALHEALHLLFAEIDYIVKDESLSQSQKTAALERAEHGVIRGLEDILLAVPFDDEPYKFYRVRDEKDCGSRGDSGQGRKV